ncbi:MAG: MFS transporter [Candidatus Nanopelagicales bacterium]|nr:MFS transporter [Candidatus Nanopelagicales bacterium]
MSTEGGTSERPARGGLILLALITGAIVANINLSVANVALPTIGVDLSASQDQLDSIAEAFALGLAASVLYLGAVGDRYGRKRLFVLGAVLTIPTAFMSAWAPNADFLALARLASGFAAALLFPTTLSLISALFRGGARVQAIALWSGLGAGVAALGPLIGGWLLEYFWWGSVFLISVPLAVFALVIGIIVIPNRLPRDTGPVDHVGGVSSVIAVGGLVMLIQQAHNGLDTQWLVTLAITVLAFIVFFWEQGRAKRPLVSLPLARARTFWVAFVGGAITFGALIGAMFIGQQFVQNVLGYDTLEAAAVSLPSAICAAVFGAVAGRIIIRRGGRFTLSLGLASVAVAFAIMLVTWHEGVSLAWILVSYAFVGAGVGLAATPASRALMSSVPESHAGMGSAFLDLTRDFGGAVLQAVLGGMLAAQYLKQMNADITGLNPAQASQVTSAIADQLTSSFGGAEHVASQFPPAIGDQIIQAASQAFTDGKSAAMAMALLLSIAGLLLVAWRFPGKTAEEAYYAKVAGER